MGRGASGPTGETTFSRRSGCLTGEHGSCCRVVNAVRVAVARQCRAQHTTRLAALRTAVPTLEEAGRLGMKRRAIAESGAREGSRYVRGAARYARLDTVRVRPRVRARRAARSA